MKPFVKNGKHCLVLTEQQAKYWLDSGAIVPEQTAEPKKSAHQSQSPTVRKQIMPNYLSQQIDDIYSQNQFFNEVNAVWPDLWKQHASSRLRATAWTAEPANCCRAGITCSNRWRSFSRRRSTNASAPLGRQLCAAAAGRGNHLSHHHAVLVGDR